MAAKASEHPFNPVALVARRLGLNESAVGAVVRLLDEKATVPFIARYRKEATGGLDEVQIRQILEGRDTLKQLEDRRRTVLGEIERQGKLDDALRRQILAVQDKAELEDLYAPYKPKRRTKGTMAKERGLQPLADLIWSQPPSGSPKGEAQRYLDPTKEVSNVDEALAGARDICAERVADHTAVRRLVRDTFGRDAFIIVKKHKKHRDERTKFDDYDGYSEPTRRLASHRYLAIRRGETEGVLRVSVSIEDDTRLGSQVERIVGVAPRSPWAAELGLAVADGLRRLGSPRAAADLGAELKQAADHEAVEVFARNLKELLLAAPFGGQPVVAIDPGQRTGCKCVALSGTGKLLANDTIHLVHGEAALARARDQLVKLCHRHPPVAVAVGNGTHGRETEAFVRDVLRDADLAQVVVVSVNEAGASIYSASDVARAELPDHDVTVRGAVSIGRRLQDPLAELVKIDPQSIGVGQYQHDVNQSLLARKLDDLVEDCVNAVGVELNTASPSLLARVAGLGPTLGQRIVAHRDEHGRFRNRRGLLDVAGLGPKTFEQAAGFLRIRGGTQPLDASAVHPERYRLVERMASDLGVPVASLIGDRPAIEAIDKGRYTSDDVGDFTLDDILAELVKPGRDPRKSFEPPKFRDDVRRLEDLEVGMVLEGVATNVTAFGAFVDVGVHQDGLVHISELANHFVKNPSDVVKVGDKLQVRVLAVDLDRKRISLSAKQGGQRDTGRQRDRPPRPESNPRRAEAAGRKAQQPTRGQQKSDKPLDHNPFARHFRK
ncbi:MAG: RNA-binding transcriptional accessory protein [Deltaproteobacteria bacterium]|nr:MAG: RNA-binding transcriptional accessory protein [Deltaproteobacteria bacterium]